MDNFAVCSGKYRLSLLLHMKFHIYTKCMHSLRSFFRIGFLYTAAPLKLTVVFFMISFLLFSGCQSKTKESGTGTNLQGTVTISGAFALYPLAVRWAEAFQKEYPGVRIDISAGGAGKGMMDVLSGMIDLGMVSRGLSPEEMKNGAYPIKVARDAVLITINAKNPHFAELQTKGIDKSTLKELFLTDKAHTWGQALHSNATQAMHVFTRSDACGAAEVMGKYLGTTQESLAGVGVFGDPGMADAIRNDVLAIGFNNVTYIYDMSTRKKYPGLEVLPLDIDGNNVIDSVEQFYGDLDQFASAVKAGKYPSPPARDLYLVAKGKPTSEAVKAFLNWVLTKGRGMIQESGYVDLSPEQLSQEIQKVK